MYIHVHVSMSMKTHLMKESRENKHHKLRCQFIVTEPHKRIINVPAMSIILNRKTDLTLYSRGRFTI